MAVLTMSARMVIGGKMGLVLVVFSWFDVESDVVGRKFSTDVRAMKMKITIYRSGKKMIDCESKIFQARQRTYRRGCRTCCQRQKPQLLVLPTGS